MDLLVKLYERRPAAAAGALRRKGIELRRALAPEKSKLVSWVRAEFGERWACECDVSFGRVPLGVFVAARRGLPVGFACVEALAPGFFGPTGVLAPERGKGIGTALLLLALEDLAARGYAYAFIGGVGPVAFYRKAVGATPIKGSSPGPYKGL